MVDIAKFFLEFTVDESCGSARRAASARSACSRFSTKITSGNGTLEDIDKLEELCYYIKENSRAASARPHRTRFSPHSNITATSTLHTSPSTAARPAHVRHSRIRSSTPTSARAARSARATARSARSPARVRQPHVIDTQKCIKCGVCREKCKFDAIEKK